MGTPGGSGVSELLGVRRSSKSKTGAGGGGVVADVSRRTEFTNTVSVYRTLPPSASLSDHDEIGPLVSKEGFMYQQNLCARVSVRLAIQVSILLVVGGCLARSSSPMLSPFVPSDFFEKPHRNSQPLGLIARQCGRLSRGGTSRLSSLPRFITTV